MLNAYMKHNRQVTKYQSYFKKEAQKAKRDNFVEDEEFLSECIEVIDRYKQSIKEQFRDSLNEKDQLINTFKNALNRGEVMDKSGNLLQDKIEALEKGRNSILAAGYENNYDYNCFLSPTGEITKSVWDCSIDRRLSWRDILQLENAVTDAISELVSVESESKTNKLSRNNTSLTHNNPFIITESQMTDLRINYDFWLDKEDDIHNVKNIFKGYSFDDYIKMICKYDFTKVYRRGQKVRVQYNIAIIARVMGDDWGKLAADKLNCDYEELTKSSGFLEHKELKEMFLHPSP